MRNIIISNRSGSVKNHFDEINDYSFIWNNSKVVIFVLEIAVKDFLNEALAELIRYILYADRCSISLQYLIVYYFSLNLLPFYPIFVVIFPLYLLFNCLNIFWILLRVKYWLLLYLLLKLMFISISKELLLLLRLLILILSLISMALLILLLAICLTVYKLV